MKKQIIFFSTLLVLLYANNANPQQLIASSAQHYKPLAPVLLIASADEEEKEESTKEQKENKQSKEGQEEDKTQAEIQKLQDSLKQGAITPQDPNKVVPPIDIPQQQINQDKLLSQQYFDFAHKQAQSKEKIKLIPQEIIQQKIDQCEAHANQLACFEVGMIYYQGRSIEGQNLKKAFYFLDFSCDGTQRLGCYEAGIIKANLSKDYYKAFMFFDRACQAKDLRGCRNLAILFYHGLGVAKQPQIALNLLNQNCKNGDKNSCQKYYFALALAHEESKNLQGAKKYYKKSCELGDVYACQKINQIIALENKLYQQNVIQNNVLKTPPNTSLQSPKQVPMQYR